MDLTKSSFCKAVDSFTFSFKYCLEQISSNILSYLSLIERPNFSILSSSAFKVSSKFWVIYFL